MQETSESNTDKTNADGGKSDLLSDLLACPFCGETPDYPGGDGTQYDIECSCGMAMSSVQISDLMTIEERIDDDFTDYRYGEIYIERAKAEATKMWNTRAS